MQRCTVHDLNLISEHSIYVTVASISEAGAQSELAGKCELDIESGGPRKANREAEKEACPIHIGRHGYLIGPIVSNEDSTCTPSKSLGF